LTREATRGFATHPGTVLRAALSKPPARKSQRHFYRFFGAESRVGGLGVVIVATHPGRFWLGFCLAVVPLLSARSAGHSAGGCGAMHSPA
jgi:hypothetical protein